jgi:integrase/recombinase XerD
MTAAKSLTSSELSTVLKHIATKRHALRNRVMLLISVLAGLRVGEIAGLTVSDVCNVDGSVKAEVYLATHRVKHGHARTIYLNSRLQQELATYIASRKWQSTDQPLFYTQHSPRSGFTANTLAQHFYWLYKDAGICGASSHSGRKTFLTSLASQGISVFVLASLAGHRSISTTQRYITVNEDMKRKAVELV